MEAMSESDEWLEELMKREARWSGEQNLIFGWFEHPDGHNLVVRARAGTGKTTTILEGVERAPEGSILLAAFNKSIATELAGRIRNPAADCKTLHGLGFKFVRQNWARVKVDEKFERAIGLAKLAAPLAPFPMLKLIRDLHSKAREVDPFIATQGSAKDLVAVAIRFNIVPTDSDEARGWGMDRMCDAAHRAMVLAMNRCNAIDFADMIFLPLVHGWVRPSYDMVVIDEAQDMTVAQLTIAVGVCRKSGRIVVVGDDRQAIYGFRGADSGSLDRLKAGINARELGLKTTYRCPKSIVALAAMLVPDFVAADAAPDGEVTSMAFDRMILSAAEGDFVLSRKSAPLIKICMELLKRGVRARIKGNDIGKGILLLIEKLNAADVDDVPVRLEVWRARECDRARKKLPEEAADERCDFVNDQAAIVVAMLEGCADIDALNARCVKLFSDDESKPSVMLSTVHRSKGLEADNVYLIHSSFRVGSIEEDNIKYVAITRAKKRLIWVTD